MKILEEKKTREILGWYFSNVFYNKIYHNAKTTQEITDNDIRNKYKYIISIYVKHVCANAFDTIIRNIADEFNNWTKTKSFNSQIIINEICDIFLMSECSKTLSPDDKVKFVKTNLILCIKEFASIIISKYVDDIMIDNDQKKQTMVANTLRDLFIKILFKKKESINNKFILKELNPKPDTISTNAMNTIRRLIMEKSQIRKLAQGLDKEISKKNAEIEDLSAEVSKLRKTINKLTNEIEQLRQINHRHKNMNYLNQYEEFDSIRNIRDNSNIMKTDFDYEHPHRSQNDIGSNNANHVNHDHKHDLNPPPVPNLEYKPQEIPTLNLSNEAHTPPNMPNMYNDDVEIKQIGHEKKRTKKKSKSKSNSVGYHKGTKQSHTKQNEILKELNISDFMNRIENIDNELSNEM